MLENFGKWKNREDVTVKERKSIPSSSLTIDNVPIDSDESDDDVKREAQLQPPRSGHQEEGG